MSPHCWPRPSLQPHGLEFPFDSGLPGKVPVGCLDLPAHVEVPFRACHFCPSNPARNTRKSRTAREPSTRPNLRPSQSLSQSHFAATWNLQRHQRSKARPKSHLFVTRRLNTDRPLRDSFFSFVAFICQISSSLKSIPIRRFG